MTSKRNDAVLANTLITPEELWAGIDDLRVCDLRWALTDPQHGRAVYEEAHVPGAVFIDLDEDLAASDGDGRHPLPGVAEFATTLGSRGIGSSDSVVVYDDAGGTIAARMWWMLRSIGHEQVRLLDGGFRGWVAAGLPVETGNVAVESATYQARSDFTGVVTHDQLAGKTVIDVRAHDRYTGEREPVDPKAGHIPGAINIPVSENLDASSRFAAPSVLRARYSALDPDAVLSCGSGVNACHTAAAMSHAGLDIPPIYIGSFSDWSRRDLPVTVGDQP